MAVSRFRELVGKQNDGTITEAESAEIERILDAHAVTLFETCPACRGEFSLTHGVERSVHCPNCETQLSLFHTDAPGHDFHEIDATIEPRRVLGVFTIGYTILGTIPCLQCGFVYPENYSCCPGTFLAAIEMIELGDESNSPPAIRFIDNHSSTLLNSLRGGFADTFEMHHRATLNRIANRLKCGHELRIALNIEG